MRGYFDKANARLREMTTRQETIRVGDHTIETYVTEARRETQPSADAPADYDPNEFDDQPQDTALFEQTVDAIAGGLFSAETLPPRLSLCLTGTQLIVSDSTDQVKAVLARMAAGEASATLPANDDYRKLTARFDPLGNVRFMINLPRLFEAMVRIDGDKARDALEVLGTGSLRGLIGHISYREPQLEGRFELLQLLEGERQGLAKIFSLQNAALSPPPVISAESMIYVSVNVDVEMLIDEVTGMIRRADPGAAASFVESIEAFALPDGETLNLRQELLRHLHGPLTFSMGFARPYAPDSARILVTIGQRDKAAILKLFEKLQPLLPGIVVERDVPGNRIYDILAGGFSVVPVDGRLLFGTTPTVDAALAALVEGNAGTQLANDTQFQHAASFVNGDAWAVTYLDSRRMFEVSFELARYRAALEGNASLDFGQAIAMQFVQALTEGLDPAKLDKARRILDYQAPTLITARTVPEGILITQVQVRPPAVSSETNSATSR